MHGFAQAQRDRIFYQLETRPKVSQAGIQGASILFNVDLSSRISPRDTNGFTFSVTAWLYDAQGRPVSALPDADLYKAPDGRFRDSTIIRAGNGTVQLESEYLFLPYYAMALEPGPQPLSVRLSLRNLRSGNLVTETDLIPLQIQMPSVKLFSFQLQALEVYDTDGLGATWDPVVFSPRELYPDLEWLLRRGAERVHLSDRVKNRLDYTIDEVKDQTRVFSLAEGDSISLIVRDYDLLSSSDIIGTQQIVPWSAKHDATINTAFGRVKKASYVLRETVIPKVQVTELTADEGYRERGISGVRLRFHFDLGQLSKGGQIQLVPEFLWGGKAYAPRFMRIKAGPALPGTNLALSLVRPNGDVEVFFPWYALPEGKAEGLRLNAVMLVEGKSFALSTQQVLLSKSRELPEDFEFGQLSIAHDSMDHIMGLRISCAYRISSLYLTELANTSLSLKPSIIAPNGPLPVESMQLRAPAGVSLYQGALPITADRDTGSFDLFVPYHLLSGLKGPQVFSINYAGMLRYQGVDYPIGARATETVVDLPEIHPHRFQIKEVAAKREKWMLTDPNIAWRVMIGNHQCYTSRVIYAQKNPRWKGNESVLLYAHPQDEVRIEILHMTHENQARILSLWKGPLSSLPTGGGKSGNLKLPGVKRVLFRIE